MSQKPKDGSPARQNYKARLWALVRARAVLDCETAASTLVDAGGDVERAIEWTRECLCGWERIGALQVARKREANGRKRYVLVKDFGPTPPGFTPKAIRRRELLEARMKGKAK